MFPPIEKERSCSIIAIVPEKTICNIGCVDVDLQVGISKEDHSNANDDLEEGERKLTPAHLKAWRSIKKYNSLTNLSIFLGVLDTVNADDMVRHLGLKLVPRTPIHVWLTTLKLVEESTDNSNITFPLMLWRYQDTSSIIQRHIATVSNIDKASNPYISSIVSISNNMIWYETEKKFGDQKERNVANEDSFLYILFDCINVTVTIYRQKDSKLPNHSFYYVSNKQIK